jgi:DNA-binding NtrC family response regulator
MSEKKRVLLVDDDPQILFCFEQLLKGHFELDVASGPGLALEFITTRGPYAVVVSDLRMPGMSGLELLWKTKEISPRTVGVLMSGSVESDIVTESIDKGIAYRVVEKPCVPSDLIRMIDEALGHYERHKTA